MRICTTASRLALTAGQTATFHDAQGTRIECLSGSLWITQENEGRDIMLGPGEVIVLDRKGKAVAHAFKPSLVLAFESREVRLEAPWWKRVACAWLRHFMELGMRRSAWRCACRI